jgi:hypothetical protein
MSSTKISITLNRPKDWEEWIEIIQTMARRERVWEFMNPRTSKEALPELKISEIEVPQAVQAMTKATIVAEREIAEAAARVTTRAWGTSQGAGSDDPRPYVLSEWEKSELLEYRKTRENQVWKTAHRSWRY